MLRPGHATLPSTYLPKNGTRRTLKLRANDGRSVSSIPSLTVCRISVSPKHKVPYLAANILRDRSHVLYLPTQKRFQAILDGRYKERQEGLRMGFTGNLMQDKKTVRCWAKRRIDHAVTRALRMRGFDRNGRRMVDPDANTMYESRSNSSPVHLTGEDVPEALIGSVEICALHCSIETSFDEVQRQARVMVDKILKICGRYSDGRPYDWPQRSGKHHTA